MRKYSKHGLDGTRFNKIWYKMRERCLNKNYPEFHFYGGRGIECLWNDFCSFRDDMYESYLSHCELYSIKETQIDRIDVNGNYCKENCRWVTPKENSRNRRSNRMITYNGKTLSMIEWSELLNITYSALEHRLARGWTLEEALIPKMYKNQYA